MLPLENATCFIIGNGAIAKLEPVLAIREGRLLVTVNRADRRHDIQPDVSFWIGGGVYDGTVFFDDVLCVCDMSVRQNPRHIGIPVRGGPLPRFLNPGRLVLRPNGAVVAAMWAASLGCDPVILLGCACEPDDTKAPHQWAAMQEARDEVLATYPQIVDGDDLRQRIRILRAERASHVQKYAQAHVTDAPERIREFYR